MPMPPDGLIDGRCWWCAGDAEYVRYHDEEWGRPVADDVRLYEKICLEGFQAGLSWLTILRKRPRFREVFHGFDPARVARMTQRDVDLLLKDAGIIRHRGKIESTINNAKRALDAIDMHGSLAAWLWSFAPEGDDKPLRSPKDIQSVTEASTALSKALRKAGWSFVGPTTMHAFMQSVGMVSDHLEGCRTSTDIVREWATFHRPGT